MILTITEPEALALTVRGDVPGVLDGYDSWLEVRRARADGAVTWNRQLPSKGAWRHGLGSDCSPARADEVRLPLANPLVQAHLVGWLGRGERCDAFPGMAHVPVVPSRSGLPACPRCSDTLWLRPKHNRYAWLTPETHGGLPDWIRLALIWGSVVRVAAGMGPLKPDVLLPRNGAGRVGYLGEVLLDRHAPLGVDEVRSAETIDAYWLSLGISLIDNASSGRVIRFEVPNG